MAVTHSDHRPGPHPEAGHRSTRSERAGRDQRVERWLVGLGLIGALAALAAADMFWTVISGGFR